MVSPPTRTQVLGLLVTTLLLGGSCAGTSGKVGEPRLVDLDGGELEPLAPRQGAERPTATVFVFVKTDCPISNRYAPEVVRLHEEFAPEGVRFWLVYADPHESPELIRQHLAEFGYAIPAARDPLHELVRTTGVRVTPEAAVFDSSHTLAYVGRIDDLYVDFGRRRGTPTRHDLREALTALVEGRRVSVARTPAIGCYIPKLR